MLAAVTRDIERGGAIAVVALHGLGGVGKTQLAVEYAWQNFGKYDLAWWINAEQPALIEPQVAALAELLALPATGLDQARAVLEALRRRDRWLLIFDDAKDPADIRPWLPGGDGHVLVTSRNPVWGAICQKVEIHVMTPPEATTLLRRRVPTIGAAEAMALAQELGFLPLALEQAASYMERTGALPAAYLHRFRSRRKQMLASGTDLAYGGNIDSAWSLALSQLTGQVPAAATLLQLCAFCAPEPIPLTLFRLSHEFLPAVLAEAIHGDDPNGSLDDLIAEILRFSMARRHGDALQLHRLMQDVIIARMSGPEHATLASATSQILARAAASLPDWLTPWHAWALLGPHLLHAATRLGTDDPSRLRRQAIRFCIELLYTGAQYQAGHQVATQLYASYAAALSDDHPDTLRSAAVLAESILLTGGDDRARSLAERTYARQCVALGTDDPDTLETASTLCSMRYHAGDLQAALALARDTLERRCKVLGTNHVDALWSADTLARLLDSVGDLEAARVLYDDTLTRRRAALGEDHLTTVWSLHQLATRLDLSGDHAAARTVMEDALSRYWRRLGKDHPQSLGAADTLATILIHVGELNKARELARDTLARRRQLMPAGGRRARFLGSGKDQPADETARTASRS